ncbi:MAG TPA: hypothetical protein VKI19_01420 [Acidimicrobiales bacterium]|nr:hypothetical protein [Acidimicrobiales bacterium]
MLEPDVGLESDAAQQRPQLQHMVSYGIVAGEARYELVNARQIPPI